jgi:hypothetical protein
MTKDRMGGIAFLFAVFAIFGSACSTIHPLNPHHRGFLDRGPGDTDRGEFSPAPSRLEFGASGGEFGAAARGGGKAVEVSPVALRWPLAKVALTSGFGGRGHNFHEGVDLRANTGTPVYAAQGGTVVYAGSRLRGYGNLVVIRHAMGVSTIYAHNSKLLVRTGQVVRQGQRISLAGRSGHASGPHLHFEVRSGSTALDPVDAMPKFTETAVAYAPAHPPAPPTAPMVAARRRPATAVREKRIATSRSAPRRRVAHMRHPVTTRNRLALQRIRSEHSRTEREDD